MKLSVSDFISQRYYLSREYTSLLSVKMLRNTLKCRDTRHGCTVLCVPDMELITGFS